MDPIEALNVIATGAGSDARNALDGIRASIGFQPAEDDIRLAMGAAVNPHRRRMLASLIPELPYAWEYTDTFGGEANYSWVRRGTVHARDLRTATRLARAAAGMTGARGCYCEIGDGSEWRPTGICTVLFVNFDSEG